MDTDSDVRQRLAPRLFTDPYVLWGLLELLGAFISHRFDLGLQYGDLQQIRQHHPAGRFSPLGPGHQIGTFNW
jgi:hypothetical protein